MPPLLVLLPLLAGCADPLVSLPIGYSPEEVKSPDYADVEAIFQVHCAQCHLGGAAAGGFDLEGGESLLVGVQSGQSDWLLVAPGEPEWSYLVAKLQGTHLEAGGSGTQMPVGTPLAKSELRTVMNWVRQLSAAGDDEPLNHATHIQPLWDRDCVVCHGAEAPSGGLSLVDGFASLVGQPSVESPGAVLVEPGDVAASYLFTKFEDGGSGRVMPPSGVSFSTEELALIESWVAAGAPATAADVQGDDTGAP
jgi:mono/diheme cytochrome c family protein